MCRKRSVMWLMVVGMLAIGLTPSVVYAQSAQSASLLGKATDESGAVMPGTTVTVTGPALQVPQLTTVTGAEGDYRVLDLPAGDYTITFELPGFLTLVRSGVHLTVGSSGRIDVVMKIGTVAETVEVSGISPVVDTVNTVGQTTLIAEQLRSIPMGGTMQEMLPLAAGVSMGATPDVGDSNLAERSAIITYGVVLQTTLDVEGINLTTAHAANTAVYLNSFALDEVQFKTSGNNAEIAFPGVAQQAVMKSGSNTLHGSGFSSYQDRKFQGNNVTPALAAQGITNPNPLKFFYEYNVDLGGRIIHDKLWFYGGHSKQSVTQGQIGFVGAPNKDGCWLASCGGTTPAEVEQALPQYNGKVSYQLNSSTRLIASELYAVKHLSSNGAATLTPLPSTNYQRQPGKTWKTEMQSAPNAKLLVNALFGHAGYHVNYIPQPGFNVIGYPDGTDVAGNPSSRELSNGLNYGPSPSSVNRPQKRYELKGSITYIPSQAHLGGTHQLKFGTTDDWEFAATRVLKDKVAGNYQLQFNRGVPSQIAIYNFPFATQTNSLYSQAVYVTDTYTRKRVTLNAGVRWERYHSFYPNQTKEAGQFSSIFPARTYPGQDVLTWIDTVPRVGVAWDVTGNGKTVVKGSFGMFGDTMGNLYAIDFNPNSQATQTYAWTGPCVVTPFKNNTFNNTSCDVTPEFLASLPSLTPLSATGGINSIVTPDLKQNKTYEYTVRVERELVANVALGVGYVSHWLPYLRNNLQYLRPYDIWVPAVPATPFLDHDGTPVTIYTFPASHVGSAFNKLEATTAPTSRANSFHSVEASLSKRYSKRWNAAGSFWATKNHAWVGNGATPQSPNDDRFAINDTWSWEARANATYNLPMDIALSSSFRAESGRPEQRTQVFTAPSSVLRQGSVTLRMGPYGEFQNPAVVLVALKATKHFSLGAGKRVRVDFQAFNLLNNSSSTSTNYQTGSTFGLVTNTVSARVFRLGTGFTF